MTRFVWGGALTVAALAALGYLYVNAADGAPADWHRDPLTAEGTGRPNEFRVAPPGLRDDAVDSPVFAMTPGELAQAFDAVALAQPRTKRLAGDPAEGFVTYVQRTPLIGWPDYVSVRAVDAADGAALAIWSRSRFGYGDLGVNRARVEDWLAALAARAPG